MASTTDDSNGSSPPVSHKRQKAIYDWEVLQMSLGGNIPESPIEEGETQVSPKSWFYITKEKLH